VSKYAHSVKSQHAGGNAAPFWFAPVLNQLNVMQAQSNAMQAQSNAMQVQLNVMQAQSNAMQVSQDRLLVYGFIVNSRLVNGNAERADDSVFPLPNTAGGNPPYFPLTRGEMQTLTIPECTGLLNFYNINIPVAYAGNVQFLRNVLRRHCNVPHPDF